MKAYKGFNKDMTCRGFQFKEGETYHEDKAELCESGFHACTNPLDCYKYYAPGKSVYHEVELEDESKNKSDDSKVCGKTIKIGAEIDVAKICKLHFDFVKSQTTNEKNGMDYSSLSALDYSSLSALNSSSLSALNYSSLSARNSSSLSARNSSSLSALDYSSLSALNSSSLSALNYSSLSARNYSSLSARNSSSLSARNYSSLSALDYSSLSALDSSSLSAGKDSVIAAFNSKAKGGIGTLIALANREWINGEYKITDFKAAIVDGENIKADTWYTLKDGEFVEVKE